jgi:glycogen operon protein
MSNGRILEYLKALGITSIELMPVHAMIDEGFLVGRGLKNLWGYNSINFFTPASRFACREAVLEFREMVNAIHDAGLEVLLDVVYNHTGEADGRGPTISFRGIDNLSYYRVEPDSPGVYVNDTGCGNTLNADHPRVQALVLDSLRYWHRRMGVDGFRFDLAPVLGRSAFGFDPYHELIQAINDDAALADAKLIAEPWDPGPGGYQLGKFPLRWAEWNDNYRDTVRRFWRGEKDQLSSFAKRLHGSSDIFESHGRGPQASINFISAHDGFTLADLVSYELRHNEANGENNRDGHSSNYSCNHGVEGETDELSIRTLRRRQRLNMLATLLLSKGTPMLLSGDEFGNSQSGNNNAYAQDNETGWLDWSELDTDADFLQQVKDLVSLRAELPHLKRESYIHVHDHGGDGWHDVEWFHPGGEHMHVEQWRSDHCLTVLFADLDESGKIGENRPPDSLVAVAIMLNGGKKTVDFNLPGVSRSGAWQLAFYSAESPSCTTGQTVFKLASQSIACALFRTA